MLVARGKLTTVNTLSKQINVTTHDGSTLAVDYSPEFERRIVDHFHLQPQEITDDHVRRFIHEALEKALDDHLMAQKGG